MLKPLGNEHLTKLPISDASRATHFPCFLGCACFSGLNHHRRLRRPQEQFDQTSDPPAVCPATFSPPPMLVSKCWQDGFGEAGAPKLPRGPAISAPGTAHPAPSGQDPSPPVAVNKGRSGPPLAPRGPRQGEAWAPASPLRICTVSTLLPPFAVWPPRSRHLGFKLMALRVKAVGS